MTVLSSPAPCPQVLGRRRLLRGERHVPGRGLRFAPGPERRDSAYFESIRRSRGNRIQPRALNIPGTVRVVFLQTHGTPLSLYNV